MTEANSDSIENEDVFKKIQLSVPANMPTISARVRELYDENVTAKIIRAGTTCLEHNVSHMFHERVGPIKSFLRYTDVSLVSNYGVP
jgi:hypothetical protein